MNIGIYIYNKAEVLDFSGPFEVFSTASRLFEGSNPYNVFLIGETEKNVAARGGYYVVPHFGFDNHPAIDVLIVVGGDHTDEMNKPQVIEWIGQQAELASTVASVCTGAFLLAQAGVLTAQKVTTHWEDIDDLKRSFPRLDVVEGVRWVEAGKYLTSAGISAGIDMSLHLVERLCDKALAQRTARQMDYDWIENTAPVPA